MVLMNPCTSEQRASAKSPVRKNRTPGSVRGRSGNWPYLPRYSPSLGRWLSRDPIHERAFETVRILQSNLSMWNKQKRIRMLNDSASGAASLLRKFPYETADGLNPYRFVGNSPISAFDALGDKKCFDRDAYAACEKDAMDKFDLCMDLAKKQYDVLIEAMELEYNICKENCAQWALPVELACYAGCAYTLGIQSSLASAYLLSWTSTCGNVVAIELAACLAGAWYEVADGCPCPR